MHETEYKQLEALFLALGDKTRLKLLGLMADGPVAVGYLAESLGESQPKVSRHLAYLRNAGLANTRRDGKWIYYGIAYPDNAVIRGILDNIVRSVSGHGLRRDEGLPTRDMHPVDKAVGSDTDIYGYADVNEVEVHHPREWDESMEDPIPKEEMEIFLL